MIKKLARILTVLTLLALLYYVIQGGEALNNLF